MNSKMVFRVPGKKPVETPDEVVIVNLEEYPDFAKELQIHRNILELKEIVTDQIQMQLMKNSKISKAAREVRNKIKRGKLDVEKEIIDIISRYMCRINHSQAVFDKMVQEFKRKFVLKNLKISDPIAIDKLPTGEAKILTSGDDWEIKYEEINFSEYRQVMKFVREFYNLPVVTSALIGIAYFNMQTMSGSNWSPVETHEVVRKFKRRGYVIVECFASLINNLNAHSYIHGNNDQPSDYVLTACVYDRAVDKVIGSFPDGIYKILKTMDPNKKYLFDINPVYAEDVIIDAFAVAAYLRNNYKVSVLMVLPWWDDLYEAEPCATYIKQIGGKMNLIRSTDIMTFIYRKKLSFNQYLLVADD